MKLFLLIFLVVFTNGIFSQILLVEQSQTCSHDYDDFNIAKNRYIVDTSFCSDTFKIIISNVQNCAYDKAIHEYNLIDNKLFISNTLEKEMIDSLNNVILFIVIEEECDCLFQFAYKFLGLTKGNLYEIIYNNKPIYHNK